VFCRDLAGGIGRLDGQARQRTSPAIVNKVKDILEVCQQKSMFGENTLECSKQNLVLVSVLTDEGFAGSFPGGSNMRATPQFYMGSSFTNVLRYPHGSDG
jgi:hypothetical protein